jgi:hypothetical protein
VTRRVQVDLSGQNQNGLVGSVPRCAQTESGKPVRMPEQTGIASCHPQPTNTPVSRNSLLIRFPLRHTEFVLSITIQGRRDASNHVLNRPGRISGGAINLRYLASGAGRLNLDVLRTEFNDGPSRIWVVPMQSRNRELFVFVTGGSGLPPNPMRKVSQAFPRSELEKQIGRVKNPCWIRVPVCGL